MTGGGLSAATIHDFSATGTDSFGFIPLLSGAGRLKVQAVPLPHNTGPHFQLLPNHMQASRRVAAVFGGMDTIHDWYICDTQSRLHQFLYRSGNSA